MKSRFDKKLPIAATHAMPYIHKDQRKIVYQANQQLWITQVAMEWAAAIVGFCNTLDCIIQIGVRTTHCDSTVAPKGSLEPVTSAGVLEG